MGGDCLAHVGEKNRKKKDIAFTIQSMFGSLTGLHRMDVPFVDHSLSLYRNNKITLITLLLIKGGG